MNNKAFIYHTVLVSILFRNLLKHSSPLGKLCG